LKALVASKNSNKQTNHYSSSMQLTISVSLYTSLMTYVP